MVAVWPYINEPTLTPVMVGGKPVDPPQAASKETRQVAEMSLRIDMGYWPLNASRRLPFEGNK